ncbi:MAG: hypothetical protein AAF431_13995 [Pseudomonadota bacterium]
MSKSNRKTVFSNPKLRALLATLGVFLAAIVITAGLPVYLPLSEINRIATPVLLFPLIWFALFLMVVMTERIKTMAVFLLAMVLIHGYIAYSAVV